MKICTPSARRLWSSRLRMSRFSLNASNKLRRLFEAFNEKRDILNLQTVVEQVEDVALLVERLEQAPQLVDRRQLSGAHQVRLPGDDVLHAVALVALEHVFGDRDR